ncbi:MAG: hypothetical protein JNK15_21465, partial [Planctomycetes bacterium]|nr:hypothetical protein [Planctomycetota bacterium]
MTVMRAVLLGIAVVLAMVVASVRAEPDRWPAVVVWAGRMQRAASLELSPCPALGRDAKAGERADGYAEAVRRLQARDRTVGERWHALATDRSEWPLTPADRERLAAVAPALDELRAAVRCERRLPVTVAAAEALVDAVRAL